MTKKHNTHNKYRRSSMPYITGIAYKLPVIEANITMGYDDIKQDTLKIDGPLIPNIRKLINKYGIPQEVLYK